MGTSGEKVVLSLFTSLKTDRTIPRQIPEEREVMKHVWKDVAKR